MLLKKEVIEFLYTTRCKSVTGWRRRGCSCQGLSAARCSLKGEPELKSIKEIHVTCSLPRLGGSIHVRSRSCLQLTDPACDTAIINHLVHELLVTDGAGVGEDALVSVLAPLQSSVVAKLLPTLLTDVPATFLFTKEPKMVKEALQN